MKTLRSQVVVDGLRFPEGIRWHGGKLWFSDMLGLKVICWDPSTRRKRIVAAMKDKPSGLGFLPDGKLLVVCMDECVLMRVDVGGPSPFADLGHLCERMNDMVVDGKGRAYVGIRDYRDPSEQTGKIALVEPAGKCRVVADGMKSPNGLAVSADGKTLFASDTMAYNITAYDISEDGSLINRRLFADLGDASPDGLCLDAEGALWVGFPMQGEFRRILRGGKVTHRIVYPDRMGLAAALGGADRRTLYLCTVNMMSAAEVARIVKDASPEDVRNLTGHIEAVEKVDYPGAGWP